MWRGQTAFPASDCCTGCWEHIHIAPTNTQLGNYLYCSKWTSCPIYIHDSLTCMFFLVHKWGAFLAKSLRSWMVSLFTAFLGSSFKYWRRRRIYKTRRKTERNTVKKKTAKGIISPFYFIVTCFFVLFFDGYILQYIHYHLNVWGR